MYLQRKTWGKRIFTVASIVLLGLWTLAACGQDNAAQQDTDSTAAAKPVIPDTGTTASPSNDVAKPVIPDTGTTASPSNDVAKATTLPATDTPPSRVSTVHSSTYVIGVGDQLGISVWHEGELSKNVPVRPDGMITLPLIGEIKASGLTPVQLKDQITAALEKVVSDPEVQVMVEAVNSLSYNIMGNVYKPGYYPLPRPITVLDAIALSGGFRDFAKQKKIYILRTAPNGTQQKIHFNYKQVIRGQRMAQNIMVEPHDTIVVP